MNVLVFIKGLSVGFAIAAPVGPIGLLCIRRSLAEGRGVGMATGLGAATADALYGCVAGFGLTAISGFLGGQQWWLSLLGGLFLCYLGVRTALSRPVGQPAEVSGKGLPGAYLSTLLLTLANPATILSFIALFGQISASGTPSYSTAALLVAGVFTGSALWWLLLVTGVASLRAKVTPSVMLFINRASGLLIFGFGILALAQTVQGVTSRTR